MSSSREGDHVPFVQARFYLFKSKGRPPSLRESVLVVVGLSPTDQLPLLITWVLSPHRTVLRVP